jgi:hypothetical protein
MLCPAIRADNLWRAKAGRTDCWAQLLSSFLAGDPNEDRRGSELVTRSTPLAAPPTDSRGDA